MSRLRYGSRRVVIEVIAVSLVAGVVVGGLWVVLAPDVVAVVGTEGEVRVPFAEVDGIFPRAAVLTALSAGAGALLAMYYAVRFRMRPVSALLASVVGGAAGTALAVLVGRMIGPGDVTARAADADAGDHLVMPLTLDAYGLLVAWPLAAAIVMFAAAMVRDDRSAWGRGNDQSRPTGAVAADVN